MTTKSFRNYKTEDTLSKLKQQIDQESKKTKEKDERFWYPVKQKVTDPKTKKTEMTGYAVVRFLPSSEGTLEAKNWKHTFQDRKPGTKFPDPVGEEYTGKWYIENCPYEHKGECPVCKENGKAYASKDEDRIKVAKHRGITKHWISNVLVIHDSANPENDGKVFLYQYGSMLRDILLAPLSPKFPTDPTFDPYNPYSGADFEIKITEEDGYTKYTKSQFKAPSALFGGDDTKMDELASKVFSLAEFTNPSKFKDYSVLEKRFNEVIGKMPLEGKTSVAPSLNKLEEKYEASLPEDDIPDFSSQELSDDLAEIQKLLE